MIKRLFLLNGLAILAVVCNHAVGWGYTAMFWWTDRYQPVTVPNYDQMGSLTYYVLLVIKQLTTFSVPAFLFVSGFFVAYAARGNQFTFSWKMVWMRISNLVVPYLIWSVVTFAVDYILKVRYAPIEYLARLATGNATPAYFFVPLLCQLYVLAPFVVSTAKNHWQWLCAGAMILHLATIGATYTDIFDIRPLGIDWSWIATSMWLFARWAIFFVLGVVSSFQLQSVKQMLAQAKWGLLITTLVLAVLAVTEPEWLLRVTGKDWRGGALTLSTSLYALVFIFCFLAFEKAEIPFTNLFTLLGNKSYGIYLAHPKGLEVVARLAYHFTPWLLAQQILYQPVLIGLGVGMPMLLMEIVSRSPLRKAYRYLFG